MYIHRHISVNNSSLDEIRFKNELVMAAYLMENESALAIHKTLSEVSIFKNELVVP